jgi:hypothetical protein
MADGRPRRVRRAHTVRLRCGTLLGYEAPTFVPAVGEVVPCHRHGYCPVVSRDCAVEDGRARGGRTRQRRSQRELLDFLRRRPVTSVHALRSQRFTLRMVTAAEKDGLVEVDLVSGRIALRSDAAGREGPSRPPPAQP